MAPAAAMFLKQSATFSDRCMETNSLSDVDDVPVVALKGFCKKLSGAADARPHTAVKQIGL